MHAIHSSSPLLVAIVIAGMAGSAGAAQKPAPPPPLPSYEELDKDKNGIVTLSEIDVYPPAIAARLRKCDLDKDKTLSREAYARCEHDAHAPSR